MARFFFHLHECGKTLIDEEGRELPDLEAARFRAMQGARDLMCGEIEQGRLCLGCSIEVTDESGASVLTLAFRDAVRITGR